MQQNYFVFLLNFVVSTHFKLFVFLQVTCLKTNLQSCLKGFLKD